MSYFFTSLGLVYFVINSVLCFNKRLKFKISIFFYRKFSSETRNYCKKNDMDKRMYDKT